VFSPRNARELSVVGARFDVRPWFHLPDRLLPI
jgi:hypothetical protein